MNCKNTYCIYQSKGECILDNISIDSLGGCADCIIVYLSDSELKVLKQRQLARYEKLEY